MLFTKYRKIIELISEKVFDLCVIYAKINMYMHYVYIVFISRILFWVRGT